MIKVDNKAEILAYTDPFYNSYISCHKDTNVDLLHYEYTLPRIKTATTTAYGRYTGQFKYTVH
jgi:hypothetical protein